MGHIKLDFFVNASVEQVWNFGLQAERIPEWQFDVVEVKGINGPIDHEGMKYTLVYKKFGCLLDSPVEVSRFDPECRTIETTGRTPLGGYFRSRTIMENVGENNTHVNWTMDYKLPGWILGSLLDKLLFEKAFRKTVQKYNDGFKTLAEETILSKD